MQLRTRITITFLLLLAAVLAAAFGAVSVANHRNAAREVERQLDTGTLVFRRVLESNQRQLTQAAETVAADYGFREAVATHDTETLVSALENAGDRVGASMVVLTSLEGKVLASFGSKAQTGTQFFASGAQLSAARAEQSSVLLESGHVYQLVGVVVRSPLPVALIYMGFELNAQAAHELSAITGLGVTLSARSHGTLSRLVSTLPAKTAREAEVATRQITLSDGQGTEVLATLSRSLTEARAPFDRLTNILFLIATISLIASAGAIVWLARNITHPLLKLTATVDQIRAGSYETSIAVERRDELGKLAEGLQVMQSAVRERDQAIRRLAFNDTLTGLNNRLGFKTSLTQAVRDTRGPIAVAVINICRFRRINELLGFSVGDAVLIEIAARLTRSGAALSVGRLAADGFVAFTALDAGSSVSAWGAALLAFLNDPVSVESQPIDLTATIGLALAPDHAQDADELLRCADLAMQRARRDKQPIALYQASLQPRAREQLSLLGELRRAVDQDELLLYFQPKVELSTGHVAGAEVLLRWQHPTRGLLGPAAFIPFAEQAGFVSRLTRWALDRAAAQSAGWLRGDTPMQLAVNVSADDLSDPHFDQCVSSILARHRLPSELMTLEITESGFIDDPAKALRMLDTLAVIGVRLSIDDFGTGYSSLSHLARMPVHEVKIDRSFVQGLETNAEFSSVVRSAIEMGHGLGLKVVAEGIETQAAAHALRDMHCDVGQGFLYAKPMPVAEFEEWLANPSRIIDAPGHEPIERQGGLVLPRLHRSAG